ncbi:MAG: hypothetical protein K2X55_29865 [Burkholderiaceae bacterium]|nr:hypothetical protein [Burkholderiaceae bacterium]
MTAAIKPAFKAGQKVKARSAKSGTVADGKFVKERPGAKGVYYEVDLGAAGIKSFRPAQVTAA